MILYGIILLVVILVLFFLLEYHAASKTSEWTAVTAGNDYGATVDPKTGSFVWPLAPKSVHYVTKDCDSLAGHTGVRLRFRIKADPGVEFRLMEKVDNEEVVVPGSVAWGPVLYFERKGDDWSGKGDYDGYRWWASSVPSKPIAVGDDYLIEAHFEDKWTGVQDYDSITNTVAFVEALREAGKVGFTFPGQSGLGHGACATGKAFFEVIEFSLIP